MRLDEPIDYMSVTSFRAYMECPYRFYLSRVLKLAAVEDTADELDPPAFGGLIHDVLQAFGKSSLRESAVAADIADFLLDQLGRVAFARYGRDPLPALLVQLEHARARLQKFAQWQADWRNAGWRIEQTEELQGADRFELKLDDGRTMLVGGRIDRIDRHEREGTWAILDYKTSESGKGPQETHRNKDEWVDLQLPLYRHIAREKGVSGDVRLGYIVLPKDVDQVGERLAEWTEQELAEADAVAKDIAGHVLDQQFWPPVEDPPYRPTDFAAICQEDVFGRRLAGEEANVGQASSLPSNRNDDRQAGSLPHKGEEAAP
jgi:RecB family exonuclease